MINFERISIFLLFSFILFSVSFCFPISLLAENQGDTTEPDDSYSEAQNLDILIFGGGDFVEQVHTFHKFFDEDWIRFDAEAEHTYTITAEARDSNFNCDPIIELYGSDGTALLKRVNNSGPGGSESITWTSPGNSSTFIRFINNSVYYDSNVIYDISLLSSKLLVLPGYVTGYVTSNGVGIKGVRLEASSGAGVSLSNGRYVMALTNDSGNVNGTKFNISVHKDGYHSQSFSVTIVKDETHKIDVELVPNFNQPPTITGTPRNEIIANGYYSFRPIATDPESDSLFFSIANKPSWLSFNPETGMVLGMPNANHVGKYGPITITVQDSRGASSHLSPFMIEVQKISAFPGILMLLMKQG